jgi:membrane-bound serine protease (ClpP class)
MNKLRTILFFLFLLIPFTVRAVQAADDSSLALVLTMDGPITQAMREYLGRGIRTAGQRGAEVIILQLNTPGGDTNSMNEMVQEIRNSSIPVVVYVWPRGAWAGSAGTVITLAGHVAAMAPETAIGAASPVSAEGQDLTETLEAKTKEILQATVRSLAERRGSEAVSLAEATISQAKAVSSNEALEAGLIDFIADDLDDLLTQLEGQTVETIEGPYTIHTEGIVTEALSMTLIEQILLMLTDPNILLILMGIGVQAILIEISSPGGWVAGFIGAICLALAAYGLGVLTVNWFGLIFIAIAFVLFILDIKAPTHGALTVAGVGSFIMGALVLFNSPGTPSFQRVSLPLVIIVGIILGLTFAVILAFALRAMRAPVRTGQESIVGKTGTAKTNIADEGQVQVFSELWTAELVEGERPIKKGERIEVVSVEGLRVQVRHARANRRK